MNAKSNVIPFPVKQAAWDFPVWKRRVCIDGMHQIWDDANFDWDVCPYCKGEGCRDA